VERAVNGLFTGRALLALAGQPPQLSPLLPRARAPTASMQGAGRRVGPHLGQVGQHQLLVVLGFVLPPRHARSWSPPQIQRSGMQDTRRTSEKGWYPRSNMRICASCPGGW
jgi:hypothetical protein